MVGALLCEPTDAGCATGVIFFNNVGYLGMCGHGTIGVVTTLAHLGRSGRDSTALRPLSGSVSATLHPDGNVTVENVASFRHRAGVAVNVEGFGTVHGDVAWGGNWFFLVEDSPLRIGIGNVEALTEFSVGCSQRLREGGITGAGGEEIDHIELSVASQTPGADSQNFVLCPGKAYDRSPCGTGTSAKLACLAADANSFPGRCGGKQGFWVRCLKGRINCTTTNLSPALLDLLYHSGEPADSESR